MSWISLKNALLKEFKTTTNSAKLHKIISERKIHKDESVQEYFFNMKELASRGNIEDGALFQYVIDGIRDLNVNKVVLYGAKDINDFKEKLKCYSAMRDKNQSEMKKIDVKKPNKNVTNNINKPELMCYNCGEKGHKSRNCENKGKGTKCFACNKFGHISKNCNEKKEESSGSNFRRLFDATQNIMNKKIKIKNQDFSALFDTGSDFNVITNDVYNRILKPKLSESRLSLTGFGNHSDNNKIKPFGNFHHEIKIDDDTYDLVFHVVPTDCMDVDVVLGTELCKYAEIKINANGVKIQKSVETPCNDEVSRIMSINAIQKSDDIDIDVDASVEAKEEVFNLITNYKPQKDKTTNVLMNIILKDDTPIHCQPRRLPFSERQVVEIQEEEEEEDEEDHDDCEEALSSDEDEIDVFAPMFLENLADMSSQKANESGFSMKAEIKNEEDEDEDTEDENEESDDELNGTLLESYLTPIDDEESENAIDEYITFKEVMTAISTQDQQWYTLLTSNLKRGKQEGELNPLHKEEIPFYTYHIDFLGPLESTNKSYKHIFAVIDAFTKFVWLHPTKSTTSKEAISKLDLQKIVFGNQTQIVSDKGSAFTSDEFKNYCEEERIQHIKITTSLPRSNGQVERLNSVIISVLSKLSENDPSKWYKHVARVQQVINSTFHRSIQRTPFEMLVGVKMKTKEDVTIKELIEKEMISTFLQCRDELRKAVKQQILKVQEENKKTYNLRRKTATRYNVDDLVVIKRTQLGEGSKLKAKYLGAYRVTKVKKNNSYDLTREGGTKGPKYTSTCAEFMKPWITYRKKIHSRRLNNRITDM